MREAASQLQQLQASGTVPKRRPVAGRRQTLVQLQTAMAAFSASSTIYPKSSKAAGGSSTILSSPVGQRSYVIASAATSSTSDTDPAPAEFTPNFEGQQVFVAGASGRTGIQVVKRLVKEGVPVVAFVRDVAKARTKLPGEEQGVTIVQGDVTQFETIPKAMAGCTAVVNASATNSFTNPTLPFQVEYQGTKNLIAAARQAGVSKFVMVTVIGADEVLSPFNLFGGLSLFKKLAEGEVQRSGFNYTIVRPGGLLDEVREGRGGGGVAAGKRGTFGFLNGGKSPRGPILRTKVADLCVDSIVDDAAANLLIEVATEPSQPERTTHQVFVDLL